MSTRSSIDPGDLLSIQSTGLGTGALRPHWRRALRHEEPAHKLSDDAETPPHIFNDSRIGYRMPKKETLETEGVRR